MKINQQNKKSNSLKIVSGALMLAFLACLASFAQAQTKASGTAQTKTTAGQTGEGCEKLLRDAKVVYFPIKSLTEDMYNAHLQQGDCAKLWFDSKRNEWALAIKAVPGAKSRGGTIKSNATKTATTSSATTKAQTPTETRVGTDCEQLLKTATVVYYPIKSLAEDLYNAHLRQGDCARLSYDAKRKEWALAIKAVPGAGARKGAAATTNKTSTASNKTTTTTNKNLTSSSKTADGEQIPKGASVIYFPTKESAEGIYKSSLKQGDWAKIWFDKKRGEWAVAVKPK